MPGSIMSKHEQIVGLFRAISKAVSPLSATSVANPLLLQRVTDELGDRGLVVNQEDAGRGFVHGVPFFVKLVSWPALAAMSVTARMGGVPTAASPALSL